MAVRRMLIAGRYRLHEPVGTGGMGRVWLARDEMLDRDVAVKEFVPPDWMTDEEKDRLRTRTLREARSAARLNHPHVVRIYDVVHAEDLPWIVMEYVPSRSLYQVLGEDGPFPPEAAARIGLDVLDALTAAHRAGVLHRDVKPHNVLIGYDGRVVLTDFGLATFVGDGSVTSPGLIVGSPQYVSPERARDGASTMESDLWSFGATLYAAVEGRSPYARGTAMGTLMALATEEPDPPALAGPLASVLDGLLRREPTERLTADEAADGLRAVLGADGPEPVPRPTVPAPRRPVDEAFGLSSAPGLSEPGVSSAPGLAEPGVGGPVRPRRSAPVDGVPAALAEPGVVRRVETERTAGIPVSPAPLLPGLSPPPDDTDTVPVESDAPPRRQRARLAVAGGAVVALLAVAGAGYATWQGPHDDDSQALPGASTGSSVAAGTDTGGQGAGGFSPSVCGDPPGADLPRTPQPGAARSVNGWQLLDGYSYFNAPPVFHIAVPDGWTYEKIGTTFCFRDPGGVRFLSVDPDRNPAGDPVKACQNEAKRLIAEGELPGYKQVGIERVPLLSKAADWEYTYQGKDGLRMHAMTRWFISDGRAYALGWATREFDWQVNLSTYSMLKSTFYVNQPFGKRGTPRVSLNR
jgi:tRNA A-37 threonylcarbamoyl transferase component Bud32